MYSFDHDLEEFVAIGLGTVSADGTVITSSPGVGVVKAGWHCGSQPTGGGCAASPGECQTCDNNCNVLPDDSKTPTSLTNTAGDCRMPACRAGSATQIVDTSDNPTDEASQCKQCAADGSLMNKANGTSIDACEECRDGQTKKKAGKEDIEGVETTIEFGGITNVIGAVNQALAAVGSDTTLPEVEFSLSQSEGQTCCVARGGAMTAEVETAGTLSLPFWEKEWTPTIPPWSGDYTFDFLGEPVGIAYGLKFSASVSGSVALSRTKRECEGDNCWGGSIGIGLEVSGGLFGQIPNSALPPQCGEQQNEPCSLINVEGLVTVPFDVEGSVNCEEIAGTIGVGAVTAGAQLQFAEGTFVEYTVGISIPLLQPTQIASFQAALPQ
jgi:hypothetical protein